MRYITNDEIINLDISPASCYNWVREAFLFKDKCQLPPKMSVHPQGNDFITTMPCLLPESYHRFGVKVVSRIKGNHPSLRSDLMLFDTLTAQLMAVVQTDWITGARTGAVATLAIRTLRKPNTKTYAFIGLGNTATHTLATLLCVEPDTMHQVNLFRYKDQAEKFIAKFENYTNVDFTICNTIEELVHDADVFVSCITDADGLIVKDPDILKPGILIVPIHTRGFQNCDTVFDKVFADDTGHVKGFKYFNEFRQFGELSDVLSGKISGRDNENQRILSYNIGLGLHDVYFATKIYQDFN